MGKSPSDYHSDEEATRRREATLQRMLRTPPKPHQAATKRPKGKSKGPGRRGRSSE